MNYEAARRRAVTLVEALVVVGIVGLLIQLLLPAVFSAKRGRPPPRLCA